MSKKEKDLHDGDCIIGSGVPGHTEKRGMVDFGDGSGV